MTFWLSLAVGLLVTASVYLMLRPSAMRFVLGLMILGNAVNLLIFVSGRISTAGPPLVEDGATALEAGAANPLPQALVLTAIVISFGLVSFTLALLAAARVRGGVDRLDEPITEEAP